MKYTEYAFSTSRRSGELLKYKEYAFSTSTNNHNMDTPHTQPRLIKDPPLAFRMRRILLPVKLLT